MVFPAVKPGSFLPGIWIISPVWGFLPRLADLDLIRKVPKPVITTFSPRIKVSLIKLKVELTASAEALLVKEAFLATFSISSFLVIPGLYSKWSACCKDPK